MSKETKQPRRTLADIQADVTARIVAELEQGRAPWVRPWGAMRGAGLRGNPRPHNAESGRPYSGVNVLLLEMTRAACGYASNGWLTFGQAIKAGGGVKRGEKGTRIVYSERRVFTAKDEKTGEESTRAAFILKESVVFNLEQCERLPERITCPAAYNPGENSPEAAGVAGVLERHKPELHHGGDRAFYSPSLDAVQMPMRAAFVSGAAYDATLLHELVHWTMPEHRLARSFGKAVKGNEAYAREELVAELGAAFLCAALGVDGELRHADYIASWLAVLKNDKKAIFQASSYAQKAAAYLMGEGAGANPTGPGGGDDETEGAGDDEAPAPAPIQAPAPVPAPAAVPVVVNAAPVAWRVVEVSTGRAVLELAQLEPVAAAFGAMNAAAPGVYKLEPVAGVEPAPAPVVAVRHPAADAVPTWSPKTKQPRRGGARRPAPAKGKKPAPGSKAADMVDHLKPHFSRRAGLGQAQARAFHAGFDGQASYKVTEGEPRGEFIRAALEYLEQHGDGAGRRYKLQIELVEYAAYTPKYEWLEGSYQDPETGAWSRNKRQIGWEYSHAVGLEEGTPEERAAYISAGSYKQRLRLTIKPLQVAGQVRQAA